MDPIYDYFLGTPHRNLHQLSEVMSRVTYISLRAHTGTGISRNQDKKNSGDVFEIMQVNGPEGQKLARKTPLAEGPLQSLEY